MNFSEDEITKAKELKKLGLKVKAKVLPKLGSYLNARHLPEGCTLISDEIFLITTLTEAQKDFLWLPTLDEALEICRGLEISFSQITDYLHRRRFADGREREGVYQLLIERLR